MTMDREEALLQMSSPDAGVRFRAALCLTRVAKSEDLSELLRLRNGEKDAYVRTRLSAAIAVAAGPKDTPRDPAPSEEESAREGVYLRSQAVEEVAGTLLHEIGSKLGLVASNCRREIPNYEKSRTAIHVRNLQSIFDAIAQLRSAANPAGYEEFDLSELIDQCLAVEADDFKRVGIAVQGMRPTLIYSSRHLVRLAICNGLRNALEAAESIRNGDTYEEPLVVIAWGKSNQEYWVSIIDNGPGIAYGATSLFFQMGGTTKKNHLGFGLAIVKQALDTLDGQVSLDNSASGGGRFEMRWRKVNEDSDR